MCVCVCVCKVCRACVYALVRVPEARPVAFKGGGHSGLIGWTIRPRLAGVSAWESRASKRLSGANIRIPMPAAPERGEVDVLAMWNSGKGGKERTAVCIGHFYVAAPPFSLALIGTKLLQQCCRNCRIQLVLSRYCLQGKRQSGRICLKAFSSLPLMQAQSYRPST